MALGAVAVLAVAGTGWYLADARSDLDAQSRRSATATADGPRAAAIAAGPHLVFRSTVHDSSYGKVSMVALADPAGPRAVTATSCERVDATAHRVLCLAQDRGVTLTYTARVLDADLHALQPLELNGIASRARLSTDGSLAATTAFVSGHSYASTTFSTQTLVTRVGGASYGDLERFTLRHRGHEIAPKDRNIWGVTFAADDDTFYATVAWGGRTWLARGSLAHRTLTTIRSDAECPALSPDGTRVAYKKRLGLPQGQWRLVSYDLATGVETRLAEPRSVDDQLEWLDDATVTYGLLRADSRQAVTDVWAVPADGSGAPTRLVAGAWSPSVVR
ncbi:TolB family protein [Angustibacter luteus]|uniref:TolB family protein n=1 Tax=Angustibacter luteus TaxID=658456 RepID=UPI002FECE781